MDCVNGESFGFDTIRIKENNLRIHAEDTSNTASFPGNDWRLTFNDSSNGGLNKFSIDDVDGGSQGAVWADLDNDGDYDLVNGTTWDNSANPDNNNVFENDGLGSFTEATPASISSVA